MNERLDSFQLHAYVDGEVTPADAVAIERALASDPAAAAEVAALRAQKSALHARFDPVLSAPHRLSFGASQSLPRTPRFTAWMSSRGWIGTALAATLVVGVGIGLAAGWAVYGHADFRDTVARLPSTRSNAPAGDARFGDFVHVAAVSHAVYTPEVRHPVEVPASDEAHLVAWLSKRLDAPVVIPHLGDAGWNLLGGRLLPAQVGPVAQFMYQDGRGRRLTLAVSHAKGGTKDAAVERTSADRAPAPVPTSAFRISEENGNTVFYWIDVDYAYALTGKLDRAEMTELASRVYRQLDR
jgi:anti-sigma factor RsiW